MMVAAVKYEKFWGAKIIEAHMLATKWANFPNCIHFRILSETVAIGVNYGSLHNKFNLIAVVDRSLDDTYI